MSTPRVTPDGSGAGHRLGSACDPPSLGPTPAMARVTFVSPVTARSECPGQIPSLTAGSVRCRRTDRASRPTCGFAAIATLTCGNVVTADHGASRSIRRCCVSRVSALASEAVAARLWLCSPTSQQIADSVCRPARRSGAALARVATPRPAPRGDAPRRDARTFADTPGLGRVRPSRRFGPRRRCTGFRGHGRASPRRAVAEPGQPFSTVLQRTSPSQAS